MPVRTTRKLWSPPAKIRFRPELALLTFFGSLLVEDETNYARTNLDVAVAELEDMHMHSARERALALLQKLRPAPHNLADRHPGRETLTTRELEVARLIAGARLCRFSP